MSVFLFAVMNKGGTVWVFKVSAKSLYPALPDSTNATMIADKGYYSYEYRAALKSKGIASCISPRQGRKAPASFCKSQYKQRHKIENMFERLKHWLRIAIRYDRRTDIFMAAITIAVIII